MFLYSALMTRIFSVILRIKKSKLTSANNMIFNIASDICLTRNVWSTRDLLRSWRFVCRCYTSSGDKIYCKQACFILYGWTGGQIIRTITYYLHWLSLFEGSTLYKPCFSVDSSIPKMFTLKKWHTFTGNWYVIFMTCKMHYLNLHWFLLLL